MYETFPDKNSLSKQYVEDIKRLVASHMGQWNTCDYSSVVLPKPIEPDEEFVHLCDYLASQKNIEIKL